MGHPFFDNSEYPWSRKDARDLRDLLTNVIPDPREIEDVYQTSGGNVGDLNLNQNPRSLWKDVLDLLSQGGLLRQLCERLKEIDRLAKNGLFQKAIEDVVNATSTDSEATPMGKEARRPNNVSKLPDPYVDRPERFGKAKSALLDRGNGTPGGRKIGLWGMSGSGKSVIAQALAWDREIGEAFSDGVVWIDLGPTPSLMVRQAQLITALRASGELSDVQQGQARLSELLSDKRCLIILDDVARAQHLAAFDRLGSHCAMLLTTRIADVVPEGSDAKLEVGPLDVEPAMELLAAWGDQTVDELPAEARDVAREVDNLPLGLAIAGAMAKGRADGWRRVLYRLQHADLEKLAFEFPNYGHGNLLAALEASVTDLGEEHAARYVELAVFQGRGRIPQSALEALWRSEGMSDYDVEDLIREFVNRSLAREIEPGVVVLQNLQMDYASVKVGDDSLVGLHDRLLTGYRDRCPSGWESGPSDGYYFQHLPFHLHMAKRADELRQLLLHFGWLRAKLTQAGVTSMLADFELLPDDPAIRLVKGAIHLCSRVLAGDPNQLAAQLLGRLQVDDDPGIASLLREAREWTEDTWLRPLTPTLVPPGGPLLRSLYTGDGLNSVALSSAGRRAIAGSPRGTLTIWDLDGNADPLRLNHGSPVSDVALSGDGRIALSGSPGGSIKVWDVESQEERLALDNGYEVTAVGLSDAGTVALSGSWHGTLKVWDLANGADHERCTLRHGEWVTDAALSGDGRVGLSGSWDSSLKVWDLALGEEVVTFNHERVDAVGLSEDGKFAVSGSGSGDLKVWDIDQKTEVETLNCVQGVDTVALAGGGRFAVSGSQSGTVEFWDRESHGDARKLQHGAPVESVALTSDGRHALSGSSDGTVRVWDLQRIGRTMPRLEGTIWSLSGDGRKILCGSREGTLHLMDREAGELRLLHQGVPLWTVAVSASGSHAVTGSRTGLINVLDLKANSERNMDQGEWAWAVALSADGRRAISGSPTGRLRVWDVLDETRGPRDLTHGEWINTVALSADGRRAISGSPSGSLRVWDVDRELEERVLEHGHEISALALSLGGGVAVSGARDGSLRFWDLSDLEEGEAMLQQGAEIAALAVSEDAGLIISGAADGMLRVWDLATRQSIASFNGDSAIRACGLTVDQAIIAVETSGAMHVLRLEGGGRDNGPSGGAP